MIKFPLSMACEILGCKKHQLKYWQAHLDPNPERQGYSVRALLAYRVLFHFIIERTNSVNTLKQCHFIDVFQEIEGYIDKKFLLEHTVVYDHIKHVFRMLPTAKAIGYFPQTDLLNFPEAADLELLFEDLVNSILQEH
jgi:hypothetical protein